MAIPIRKVFHEAQPHEKSVKLPEVKQRKGEAEMSQVDWLVQHGSKLKPGEAAVSIVTSGDIDSLYIHLFAVSKYWPRNENDMFLNTVYVILQKPGSKYDIYNVTLMLELFEKAFLDKRIGTKLAIALCIGGNDFVPKFQQISHKTVVQMFLKPKYRLSMLNYGPNESIKLNEDCFVSFIKELYCPGKLNADSLSFETVRAITIEKKPGGNTKWIHNKGPKALVTPRIRFKAVSGHCSTANRLLDDSRIS